MNPKKKNYIYIYIYKQKPRGRAWHCLKKKYKLFVYLVYCLKTSSIKEKRFIV